MDRRSYWIILSRLPIIQDCPHRAGQCSLHCSIFKVIPCLLLFAKRYLSSWLRWVASQWEVLAAVDNMGFAGSYVAWSSWTPGWVRLFRQRCAVFGGCWWNGPHSQDTNIANTTKIWDLLDVEHFLLSKSGGFFQAWTDDPAFFLATFGAHSYSPKK